MYDDPYDPYDDPFWKWLGRMFAKTGQEVANSILGEFVSGVVGPVFEALGQVLLSLLF